jgi:hypothetical protein
MVRRPLLALTLVVALPLGACDNAATVGPARVEIGMVPADIQSHADTGWEDQPIASAEIEISSIYLAGGVDDGGRVDLALADTPMIVDILNLVEEPEIILAEGLVPGERYAQLRIVVESATVTLVDGYTFEDGTNVRTLKVPSGMQSGLKVELLGPLDADAASFNRLLLNLDPEANFVIQGGLEDPGALKGVLFTPRIQEDRRESRPRAGLSL